MKWPTMDEFAQRVADKAMDEVEFNGKTIREWTEIILATVSEDTISRRAAIEALKSKHDVFNRKDDYYTALKTIRDELPPVTYTKINPPSDYALQFGLIPKEDATKVGTNLASLGTDCISRQAAIEAMKNLCEECDADHCGECRIDYPDKDAKSVLEALPPAEPQRMRAKWIATTSLQEGQITWRDYKCSNCSHHRGKPMNYCEVCGAKMER